MQNDLFEKWYIENHPNSSLEKTEDGNYFRRKASIAWEAWQASTQRQGYKLVPVEPTEGMMMVGDEAIHYSYDEEKYTSYSVYKAMIGVVDEYAK